LVEDQPLNQELAATVLTGAGASVALAGNGAEAVHVLEEAGPGMYDLVLMDLQMPVMDGYEATRRIRGDPRFRDLPIIAMTAHALTGERARCRAAGMSDHIAKPIDLERLFRMLRRWQPSGPGRESPDESPGDLEDVAVPSADQPEPQRLLPSPITPLGVDGDHAALAMDFAAGLKRTGGDSGHYVRMLRRFGREYAGTSTRLRAEVACGEVASARQGAHALAGVALNLGLDGLGAAARALELVLEAGSSDAETALIRLDRAEAETLSLIDDYCRRQEAALEADQQVDAAAIDLPAAVRRLDALLQDRNLGARRAIGELLAQCRDAKVRGGLERIAEHIEDLEFDAARAVLKALASSTEGA
jgi:CheY-like chemotaxis protein